MTTLPPRTFAALVVASWLAVAAYVAVLYSWPYWTLFATFLLAASITWRREVVRKRHAAITGPEDCRICADQGEGAAS